MPQLRAAQIDPNVNIYSANLFLPEDQKRYQTKYVLFSSLKFAKKNPKQSNVVFVP